MDIINIVAFFTAILTLYIFIFQENTPRREKILIFVFSIVTSFLIYKFFAPKRDISIIGDENKEKQLKETLLGTWINENRLIEIQFSRDNKVDNGREKYVELNGELYDSFSINCDNRDKLVLHNLNGIQSLDLVFFIELVDGKLLLGGEKYLRQ